MGSRICSQSSPVWIDSHLNSRLQAQQCRFDLILLVIFLFTLPLLNPWVRGDGVGYFAYARAPLIEHNLDFTHDYQWANESFRVARCVEWPTQSGISHPHGPSRQSFHRWTRDALVSLPANRPWRRFARKSIRIEDPGRWLLRPVPVMPWPSPRACMDFLLYCFLFVLPANTLGQRGLSLPPLPSGGRAPSRFTCTSILRGRMPTPLLWSLCFSGIGMPRGNTAA